MSLKYDEKKADILRSAQKRFVKHGLYKTTIDEIAKDLRIAKSSIYHYYKTKEELYYLCVESEIDSFFAEIRSFSGDNPPGFAQKTEKYLQVKADIRGRYQLLYRLFVLALTGESNPFEDDLLLKFVNRDMKFIASELCAGSPIPENELKSLALQSAGLPLVSGLHEALNEKTENFLHELPVTTIYIDKMKSFFGTPPETVPEQEQPDGEAPPAS